MVTFRSNNNRRNNFRRNDRNFKSNVDRPKFGSNFSNNENFKRKAPGRNNHNAPKLIEKYKNLVLWSERIYIISPVWWFRLTPRMEVFFDEVLTPGFAYKFVNVTKTYAYPKPFLKDKKVRTYITHGAPALPVKTLYFNSVKLRLVMGVYSFVFGWKLSLWFKTKQFWSVPFVSDKKRKKYLGVVLNDIRNDLRTVNIFTQKRSLQNN